MSNRPTLRKRAPPHLKHERLRPSDWRGLEMSEDDYPALTRVDASDWHREPGVSTMRRGADCSAVDS